MANIGLPYPNSFKWKYRHLYHKSLVASDKKILPLITFSLKGILTYD